MKDKWTRFEYRKGRTRRKISEKANGRPRLTVHRSLKYIYAQIVDDAQGVTLAQASSRDDVQALRTPDDGKGKVSLSTAVGRLLAQRAKDKGITAVAFDFGAADASLAEFDRRFGGSPLAQYETGRALGESQTWRSVSRLCERRRSATRAEKGGAQRGEADVSPIDTRQRVGHRRHIQMGRAVGV